MGSLRSGPEKLWVECWTNLYVAPPLWRRMPFAPKRMTGFVITMPECNSRGEHIVKVNIPPMPACIPQQIWHYP